MRVRTSAEFWPINIYHFRCTVTLGAPDKTGICVRRDYSAQAETSATFKSKKKKKIYIYLE